jgi:hypothetical protein
VDTLQRIGHCDLSFHGGETLLHGFRRALAATTGLVGLQRFQVTPDGPALISALGQRGFVLVAHGGALAG